MLVIPVYRESPALLESLTQLQCDGESVLVVLVLNRPDSDPDVNANRELREAPQLFGDNPAQLTNSVAVYLLDLETLNGPTPQSQGVGLARKVGCDLAIKWMAQGAIESDWIYCSDADAQLPSEYFQYNPPANATAMSLPFTHVFAGKETGYAATALYELRLHHYVLGLEYAGSPYAFHTLGSSLAVKAQSYMQVRGFPKRSGAEDFYLLNKLAKLGPIARPDGPCIKLQARHSDRVPFGTGPAVNEISAADSPQALALFYHPESFAALKALLLAVTGLESATNSQLAGKLIELGLEPGLAKACNTSLANLGLEKALEHCRAHSSDTSSYLRHFHQWFDGFRTLKFIHALRDSGYPNCSFDALKKSPPAFWPQGNHQEVEQWREAICQHWGWQF